LKAQGATADLKALGSAEVSQKRKCRTPFGQTPSDERIKSGFSWRADLIADGNKQTEVSELTVSASILAEVVQTAAVNEGVEEGSLGFLAART
jgi:hypothetical protein